MSNSKNILHLSYSILEIGIIADLLIEPILRYKTIAFIAPMGTGKTTLIKALGSKLEVLGPITSPTFSILNIYQSARGLIVYHFDLYRINSIQELEEVGFFDYLYEGNILFIEWPEMVIEFLPKPSLEFHITTIQDQNRSLSVILKN